MSSNSGSLWILQKAIYDHLYSSTTLSDYLGNPIRIYDEVPDDTIFPYLILGETRTQNYAGIDGALTHETRLVLVSRYHGRRELKTIMDALYRELHDCELELPGHCLVSFRFIFSDIFRRQDQQHYQGVMRFRAVAHPETINA